MRLKYIAIIVMVIGLTFGGIGEVRKIDVVGFSLSEIGTTIFLAGILVFILDILFKVATTEEILNEKENKKVNKQINIKKKVRKK